MPDREDGKEVDVWQQLPAAEEEDDVTAVQPLAVLQFTMPG